MHWEWDCVCVQVITKLRELGEPITLFGETVADRRERLRELMATKDLDQEAEKKVRGCRAGRQGGG